MIQSTKRLVFREWLPDDWIRFKPIANDPRVVRYVTQGTVPTDEQIRGHIEAGVLSASVHEDFLGGGYRWLSRQ